MLSSMAVPRTAAMYRFVATGLKAPCAGVRETAWRRIGLATQAQRVTSLQVLAEIVHVEELPGLPDLLDACILLAKALDHPAAVAAG